MVYFYTWCGLSANLEYRSEMCCTRLAGNTGQKKIAKNWPSGYHRTTSSGYMFATKACIDNHKNLLNSNISSTCPHNMVNFGPLTAEICWRVWGTPANFNGFRVLAVLLHGSQVVSVSRTLRRWKRAPPMFGRATITLSIGSRSSFDIFLKMLTYFFSKVTQVVGTVIRCEQFFLFYIMCCKNYISVPADQESFAWQSPKDPRNIISSL